MSSTWSAGSTADDSRDTRGWFIGDFISPADDVRASRDIEVERMRHPVGDKRTDWSSWRAAASASTSPKAATP